MKTVFINGGKIDKIKITNGECNTNITARVTGDTKAKYGEAKIDVEVVLGNGEVKQIVTEVHLKRGKNNCIGTLEINIPYNICNFKILKGTVWRTC